MSKMSGKKNLLKISLLAGLLGLVGGLTVWGMATGSGYHFFPLSAGLAACGTTAGLWWLIVDRQDSYNLWAGALAGALSGGVAHYLNWYLQIVAANVCYHFTGGCAGSLGEPPVDLLNGLWGAAVLSLLSLLLVGWITVPLGAVIGAWWGTQG